MQMILDALCENIYMRSQDDSCLPVDSKFRRWRKVLPTTSSSCFVIPAASFGASTPWALIPRSSRDWPEWARGQLAPPRWSPSTSTVQTGSSLVPSPLKPWAWVWMPSLFLATFGMEEEEEAGEQALLRKPAFPSEENMPSQWHITNERCKITRKSQNTQSVNYIQIGCAFTHSSGHRWACACVHVFVNLTNTCTLTFMPLDYSRNT